MLFEDAVVLRKPVFARAVPIEEIVAISAGRHGVMFARADGNTSTSTGVGEQGIIPNRLVPDLVSRILEARDAYLRPTIWRVGRVRPRRRFVSATIRRAGGG